MKWNRSTFRLAVFVALTVSGSGSARAQDPVLDAKGFQQNRDYFSQEPFEHVDTFTGSLVLTFTDLVLPGNAGRDVRFTRTYNSKEAGGIWSFGLGGMVMTIPDTWQPTNITTDPGAWLYTSDGAAHHAATPLNQQGSDVYENVRLMATDQFWRYERASRTLSMPDGTVSHFDPQGRLINSQDPFGNLIILSWEGAQLRVTQQLGSNQPPREVVLTLAGGGSIPVTSGYLPTSMTYAGRTWTYESPQGSTPLALTQATPPMGPPWRYDYTLSHVTVTTPHGGQVRYTLETKGFLTGRNSTEMVFTTVVSDRDTFDRSGAALGHWHYAYDFQGPNVSNQTTIEGPSNTTTYLHRVVTTSNGNNNAANDYVGRTFVLASRTVVATVVAGGAELEREEQLYQYVPIRSANPADAVPEISQRVVHRNGRTYTTDYQYSAGNFGDYHHPFQIVETGELSRTTTREFLHLAAPFIVGNVTRDTVASGVDAFEQSWTYDPGTGFTRTHTEYGITTTFSPDASGNVATVTKANGKTTTSTYDWGVVKAIHTPEYVVSRSINPEGTVASETRAGRTTSFTYDNLFRIETTQPPGAAAPILTAYDNNGGAWVRVTRGSSVTTTTVDGFGKPIGTINSVNVQTRAEYDAEGRKTYEGYPFGPGFPDIGTTITYDGLGRVKVRTNPGGTVAENTYGDGTVAIRDENGHVMTHTRQAFGNPDEARLAAVTDANGQTWQYSYDALGALTRVTAPVGPNGEAIARTWHYNANHLLDAETQPESGTMSYDYDAAGVLAHKMDAKGVRFTYQYDGNDRVRSIAGGGQTTTVTYEPDSENRQIVTVGDVVSEFEYDPAGRLHVRTDTIDGQGYVRLFAYDNNDNLTQITYPSGRRVTYDYDAASRITNVRDATGARDVASVFAYHPSGVVTRFTSGNGIVNEMTLDAQRYWPRAIAAGALQLTYDNYDGVGNVQAIGDSRAGMAQTFGYDGLDRLAAASGPYGGITYGYDAHGNRTGGGQEYWPGTLRLKAQNSPPFVYDNNGNLTSTGSATYTYTPDNMMETSAGPGGSAAYRYDADGWRAKKESGGSVTFFLRGLRGELLTELKDPGTSTATTRDYLYAGSRLLAVVTVP